MNFSQQLKTNSIVLNAENLDKMWLFLLLVLLFVPLRKNRNLEKFQQGTLKVIFIFTNKYL